MSEEADKLLAVTLTPERGALLKGFNTHVNLLVQVRAPEKPEGLERSTLNLSVVLDRSGSMQGDPLETAKQCAKFVQSRLTSRDLISLIVYDDEVEVVSPSSAASPNDHYQAALDRVEVGGTTNLFGGWEAGLGEVQKRSELHEINRVLLLSDGCLNHGVTDSAVIRRACLEAANTGVKTSTYGLGRHFDESVMCMMAEVSGGNNRYGERVEDLLEGFIEELDLLTNLYSSELTLTITPRAGVKVECLNDFVKREDALVLPDLAYGAEVWAGLKLTVSQEAAESDEPLINVSVSARGRDGHHRVSQDLASLPTLSPAAFEAIAPAEVVTKYLSELQISRLKLQAAIAAQRRDWDQAKAFIAEMKALPMTDAQRAELQELEELCKRQEAEIFSKEARFSGSQSQRGMKVDANSYVKSENWVGSALFDVGSSPSYLRKKSRVGRSSDSQRFSNASIPSAPISGSGPNPKSAPDKK